VIHLPNTVTGFRSSYSLKHLAESDFNIFSSPH
jgi:hypothetical protein